MEKLGGGGMGVVYKAEDTKLKRIVALKFLPPELTLDAEAKERFIHEAQAASALDHPNICTIYEVNETAEGQMFIAMACYEGQTLKPRIAQGPLPVEQAISIAVQAAQGLSEAHAHGIIHRDIKPANIMLTARGDVKIVDFGLAKLSGATKVTKTGSTIGTIAYMAPEQLQGAQVDGRADIFSLGVVLYEMLAGTTPFHGDHEAALMYSIVNEEPARLADKRAEIPAELQRIVDKALAKDPSKRYQKAEEMLAELRQLSGPETGLKSKRVPVRASIFRRPAVISGTVVVLALVFYLAWPTIETMFAGSRKIPIAVIPFENRTGDSQYDWLRDAIPNLLISSFENYPRLKVMSWERLNDILKQIGQIDPRAIDMGVGLKICAMDSVRAMITGGFSRYGDKFVIDLKVINIDDRSIVDSARSEGQGQESIFGGQIDELSAKVASGIGLPEQAIAQQQSDSVEIPTSSPEAYAYYLRGKNEVERWLWPEARRSLSKAIEYDSTFASAYRLLAAAVRGDAKLRRDLLEKAKKYAYKASRRERIWIDASYETDREKRYMILKQIESEFPNDKSVYASLAKYYGDTRQDQLAIEHYKRALSLDPNHLMSLNELGYIYATRTNELEKALDCFRRYSLASPGDPNPLDSMGEMYFFLGKIDSAIIKYKEVEALHRPGWPSEYRMAYLYALKEDYTSALTWIDSFQTRATPDVRKIVAHWWRALYLDQLGSLTKAKREIDLGISKARFPLTWTDGYTDPQLIACMYRAKALLELKAGQIDAARGSARRYLNISKETAISFYVPRGVVPDTMRHIGYYELLNALIDLRAGKLRSAEARIDRGKRIILEWNEEEKKKTGMTYSTSPFYTEAEILLAAGKADSVIAEWPKIAPLSNLVDFHLSFTTILAYTNQFLPRDALARAYVAKGDLEAATKEYERITTFDPTHWDRRLIHPLHRYELAKLYEKKGEKEKAIAQYERFLYLWKNADRDRPEPKDAKARLARLASKQ
jgi:serine/threonine protein kinase/Tfp pilus assembly protein PilF